MCPWCVPESVPPEPVTRVCPCVYRTGFPSDPIARHEAGLEAPVIPGVRWGRLVWRTAPRSLLSSGSLVRSLTSTNPSVESAAQRLFGMGDSGRASRGEGSQANFGAQNGTEGSGPENGPWGAGRLYASSVGTGAVTRQRPRTARFPHGRGCRGRVVAGNYLIRFTAPVAQLDRASGFEPAGRPFESGRARS